jgi:hypothetical protein
MSASRQAAASVVNRHAGDAELVANPRRQPLAALRTPAADPDLLEIEFVGQQLEILKGGPAGAQMRDHARIAARQMLCAHAGDGTRSLPGEAGCLHEAERHAGFRIVERQQSYFRRQLTPPVVDVVTDDLDAGAADRPDIAWEDVEVSVHQMIEHQVSFRRQYRLAATMRVQSSSMTLTARLLSAAGLRPAHGSESGN